MAKKTLESLNRRLMYSLLRLLVRNEPLTQPLDGATMRKILILRYDKLGDMVVTTPVFTLLRERLPNAELHVLASPRNVGLLAADARIAQTIVFDGSWSSVLGLMRRLRRENYDAFFCLVFYKMTYAGLLANILGGRKPHKIMIAHEERHNLYSLWFNLLVPVSTKQPMAQTLVELVCKTFGWEYTPEPEMIRFDIAVTERHNAIAEAWFAANAPRKPCVFYNLSAGMPFRQWSFERNAACLQALTAQFPELAFVLNAAPPERGSAQHLAAMFPNAIAVLPTTPDVLELCAFMRCVDYVITPDTAITHIATAFGKPSVVLCTPLSSSIQWMPVGVSYRAVYPPESAPTDAPIEAVLPDDVVRAFRKLYTEIAS